MGCRLLFPAGHSVQFSCSVVSSCLQPFRLKHTRLPCPSPIPRACSKLVSIESVMPSNHLIFCHPLLLPPSIFPSIRVFSKRAAPPREDTAWPDPRAEDPEINDLPLPPVGATLPSSAAGALLLIPQPSQRVGGETPGLAKATPCIPPPPQAWLPAARCLQPFLGS